ncbi:MAG TPA: nitrate- and nitrite sensing domain-containing protein [Rhodocyclaceae bacterium]|nr:nitrate- and nitrite sensing domain-containing protein [Rhodocyclaceae bacterium]
MDTTLLVIATGGLAVLALLLVARLSSRGGAAARPARARHALAVAGRLLQLIAHVQQHRGMSGAWLAGDQSFATRLPDKQAAVERLFAEVRAGIEAENGEAYPCLVTADVDVLHGRWRKVVGELAAITPEESFQAHCRIVATLLDWLAALVDARIQAPLMTVIKTAATRNFSHRLPVLAECLGQARALGSTVAARGECRPVSRVRLMFLVARAEALLAQASDGACDGSAAARIEAARAVKTFAAAVRDELLAPGAIALGAGDCFALGTRGVDAVFAWLEIERRDLAAKLAERRAVVPMPGAAAGVAS